MYEVSYQNVTCTPCTTAVLQFLDDGTAVPVCGLQQGWHLNVGQPASYDMIAKEGLHIHLYCSVVVKSQPALLAAMMVIVPLSLVNHGYPYFCVGYDLNRSSIPGYTTTCEHVPAPTQLQTATPTAVPHWSSSGYVVSDIASGTKARPEYTG